MTQIIKISELSPNTGQIEGVPANPRFIRDERFAALKKSLQDDPEMLNLRELLVFPYKGQYVIIGGNMRYRAAIDIGLSQLPCKMLDPQTPIQKLQAIIIKDNIPYGQWETDLLAKDWNADILEEWGLDTDFSATDIVPDDFFEDSPNKINKPPQMVTCPFCGKEHFV